MVFCKIVTKSQFVTKLGVTKPRFHCKYVHNNDARMLSCLQFIGTVMCDRVNIRINADYSVVSIRGLREQEVISEQGKAILGSFITWKISKGGGGLDAKEYKI